MAKDRSPRAGAEPRSREVRAPAASDTNGLTPVWSLALFDADGPWGTCRFDPALDLWDVLSKLKNYESMKWSEILLNKKRDHSVEVGKLISDAQKRLEERNLGEFEELFRFRLTGEQRLWGIRDGRIFRIIWWDPEHEICPSNKQ